MKKILLILPFCLPLLMPGQETLSLQDAIEKALANNHDIRLARLNEESSELNAYKGNAGLLPQVSLNGTGNYSRSDVNVELTNQEQGPGQPATIGASVNGVETYAASLGLGVSYTLFDGFVSQNQYRVLKANAQLTHEQVRAQIEQQILGVAAAYYQLAQLQGAEAIQAQSLAISRERLARLRNQWEFGTTTELALLNAEVDLNTDSATLASTRIQVANARRNLNVLLGEALDSDFALVRDVFLSTPMPEEALMEKGLAANAYVQAAAYNQDLAALNLKIAQGARLPQLSLNASYGYNYQNNGPVSFLQELRSWGLNGGASLNIPLFNGNRLNRNIQQATLGIKNADLAYEQAVEQLMRDLINARETYQNSLAVLRLEEKNRKAAQANFDRTRETYNLGQATGTQFREAQLNLLRVRTRINDLSFQTKLEELELLRLSGSLLQDN